jgi:xanthosine utilization system XapX-like protein
MASSDFFETSVQDTSTMPLLTWQKLRLVSECLPFISFMVMVLVVFVLFRDLIGAPAPLFLLFVALVILVLGFQAIQRLRDLLSGHALVQMDSLERSYASRSGPYFWGNFKHLGRMRIVRKAYFQSPPGTTYRVIYSPVSRIVWTLERNDEYAAAKQVLSQK